MGLTVKNDGSQKRVLPWSPGNIVRHLHVHSSSEVGTIGDVWKQGKEKMEGILWTSMAVHHNKKELKEGWRDISRPDIKWMDIGHQGTVVHLHNKKKKWIKIIEGNNKR